MSGSNRSRLLWLAVGAVALVAAGLARYFPEAGHGDIVFCVFRRFTGLACPGCGLSRAFVALARGDLAAAVLFHPLAPLLAVEATVAWAVWGIRAWALNRGAVRASSVRWERLAWAHGAALLLLWAGRAASGTLPL